MLTAQALRRADVGVVEVVGEVDASTAYILRDALTEAIAEGATHVIADLTGVTFMDSSGLGVLVGRLKEIRARGGSLHVAAGHERVLRVFEVTRLDTVFPMHSSADEAFARLSGVGEAPIAT